MKPALRALLFGWLACATAGCKKGEDLVWSQVNADDDAVDVTVGADVPVGSSGGAWLHSSTGRHVIGRALLSPSSGPVGTRHQVVVSVFEEALELDEAGADTGYLPEQDLTVEGSLSERVTRVTLEASGDRGDQRFELRQDSAARGTWVTEIESQGAPNEPERIDTFTFILWEAVLEGDTPDGTTTSEASQ